jgi:O-antigen/teichoic acid export membrane protein
MENKKKQKELLGNLTLFVVSINVLLTALLCIFGDKIFSLIGCQIDFFPYILVGILTNFFNILGILPAAVFRVQERPLPLTVLNVVKGLLTMGITLILVIKYGFKAAGVLYSTLFVSIIFGIIFSIITMKNMIWIIDTRQIKQALLFSLPLLPGSLAHYAVSMSDRIFIEKYLNLFDLGIYSTASTIAMMLNIVSYGAYKAFEPYFFKIYGSETFLNSFVKVHNSFLGVLLVGSLVLSFFAQEFLYFFAGPGYQSAYYYIPMIQVGVIFSSMTLLFSTVMVAQEKTKMTSLITIIGGFTSIVLNIILLPMMGIVAACLSSGISFGLMMILSIFFTKIRMNYLRPFAGLLFASLAVWALVYKFSFESVSFSIIMKTIILAIIIIIIMFILQFSFRDIKRYIFN